jgi:hypothetical protein
MSLYVIKVQKDDVLILWNIFNKKKGEYVDDSITYNEKKRQTFWIGHTYTRQSCTNNQILK